jgi:hypothetical protein
MHIDHRVTDAAQRETVRRKAGTPASFRVVPDLQRIAACCAVPGERNRESAVA